MTCSSQNRSCQNNKFCTLNDTLEGVVPDCDRLRAASPPSRPRRHRGGARRSRPRSRPRSRQRPPPARLQPRRSRGTRRTTRARPEGGRRRARRSASRREKNRSTDCTKKILAKRTDDHGRDPPARRGSEIRDDRVGSPRARGFAAVRGFGTRAARVADSASRTRGARVVCWASRTRAAVRFVRPPADGGPSVNCDAARRTSRRDRDPRAESEAGRRVRPRARPRRRLRAKRSVYARENGRVSRARRSTLDGARRAECPARVPPRLRRSVVRGESSHPNRLRTC